MRIVTIARRPCLENTVTKNVLSHAAGALNIDATRIGAGAGVPRTGEISHENRYGERGGTNFSALPGPRGGDARGRWPANLLLQHEPGCRKTGSVRVEGYRINRWKDGAKPFGGGAGHEYDSEQLPDEDVALWECTPGCAVGDLSNQSGITQTGNVGVYKRRNTDFYMGRQPAMATTTHEGDKGTAARFFKQVQRMDDTIPQDLLDYLIELISPPPDCTPLIIADVDLGRVDFSTFEDASVHGLLTVGDPTPWLEEMDRVLRPGAHVLLISDEEDLTGSTGACAIEDFGYEIRDAVAILDLAGEFNYAAKSGRRERNEGVLPHDRILMGERLFPLPSEISNLREELAEMVDPDLLRNFVDEGLPLEEVPEDTREFFEVRTVELRRAERNSHPTVKSIAIMDALLADLPEGSVVVDPFMGSGTTGIACLRRGLNFIGIEAEAESLTIADQRIRHWDRKEAAWQRVDIESEAVPFEHESAITGGLFDFFGEEEACES